MAYHFKTERTGYPASLNGLVVGLDHVVSVDGITTQSTLGICCVHGAPSLVLGWYYASRLTMLESD
ncbi:MULTISPECIES: hypothetical protein [unclassified Vibrio]|uniref:hypothetical protein n=1 Tax=unclassified Vibrio TaxID=2614977 RepID=UPI00126820EA|nr:MULTISPECIES: hypothetical protein [unclassified Vibrio]